MSEQFIPDLNLKGLPDAIRERLYSGKKKDFCYQGIWIFSGSQGSGKTLLLMESVKQMHDEFPDAIIISNISVFGVPCIPYRGIQDFKLYNNGSKGLIFIIDEIQTLYSSLESVKMPVTDLTVWSQNRKNRRVILGTSQRFTRVSKGIREQCTYNYECRRFLGGFINRYRVLEGDNYDDNGRYIGEKEPRYHFYIPHVSVMRMYDTHQCVYPYKSVSKSKSNEEVKTVE